ncbi:MAG: hypothetical protein HXY38_03700 [Chloroflexi bacterium]|nr:hypothetical protein [Chloroflexota bacterium]
MDHRRTNFMADSSSQDWIIYVSMHDKQILLDNPIQNRGTFPTHATLARINPDLDWGAVSGGMDLSPRG